MKLIKPKQTLDRKHAYLVMLFNETRKLSKSRFKQQTKSMIKSTKVYTPTELTEFSKTLKLNILSETPIKLVMGGTVSTGYNSTLYPSNKRVAILNFANAFTPGGMVLKGSSAQEENICRCTNLYESLVSKNGKPYYTINSGMVDIGVNGEIYTDTLIYTPNVTVFRNDVNYSLITPSYVDVITCPAPCAANMDYTTAITIYEKRIQKIVLAAIANNVDTLVLGAWGCGAFGQNPRLIAQAFATVLNTYHGCFKEIIFAIRPTYGGNAVDITYNIFKEELSKGYFGGELISE